MNDKERWERLEYLMEKDCSKTRDKKLEAFIKKVRKERIKEGKQHKNDAMGIFLRSEEPRKEL